MLAIAGHIVGVVAAHDRAVRVFPRRAATKGQYSLLAMMVLFTVGRRRREARDAPDDDPTRERDRTRPAPSQVGAQHHRGAAGDDHAGRVLAQQGGI